MRILFLTSLLTFSVFSLSLEGRYIIKGDKCFIKLNEKELSSFYNLKVKCELFLVSQYKYKFVLKDNTCPYKVQKVDIIAPGVDAKETIISKIKKCPSS